MPKLFEKQYTPSELLSSVGDISQIGGITLRAFESGQARGVREALFRTGSGLEFTTLIDRALDINTAYYRGIPLFYRTPLSEVAPMYYEGQSIAWKKSWCGGLLATCGLNHFSIPITDNDEELVHHGRISNLPAKNFSIEEEWDGDDYRMTVSGTMYQSSMYQERLVLHRTLTAKLGERTFRMIDRVRNIGFRPEPHMLMYHINIGFPLLSENAQLISSPVEAEAGSEAARTTDKPFDYFCPPDNEYEHHNYALKFQLQKEDTAKIAVVNPDLLDGVGFYYQYAMSQFPYFNYWKYLKSGHYVLGIEPVNCPVWIDGELQQRPQLREKNLLPILQPGEEKRYQIDFGILDGPAEIEEFKAQVNAAS